MKIMVYDLDDTLYDTRLLKDRKKIIYDEELYTLLNNGHPSYIYTNAVLTHTLDILNKKMIKDIMKGIYHRTNIIEHMKPNIYGFRTVEEDILYKQNISIFDPVEIYFFDDLPENLKTAKRIGWKTILISSFYYEKDYIDYQYSSIKEALKDMKKKNIL